MSTSVPSLVLRSAGAGHATKVVQTWAPFHLVKELTDPGWKYQLFLWPWIIGSGSYTVNAAECSVSDLLEGLLATTVDTEGFKVAFLSTAPWNYGGARRRGGVGTALLATAVQLSIDAGYHGELHLSSTTPSEGFYQKHGLIETGDVDHEGLKIFKLEQAIVTNFLSKNPPIPRGTP